VLTKRGRDLAKSNADRLSSGCLVTGARVQGLGCERQYGNQHAPNSDAANYASPPETVQADSKNGSDVLTVVYAHL